MASIFSISVEFENPFGKVLILVADFGSTLFPFIFSFVHLSGGKNTQVGSKKLSRFMIL